jgi:hypothetical protein
MRIWPPQCKHSSGKTSYACDGRLASRARIATGQRGNDVAQRRVGGERPEVAQPVLARRRHQCGDPVDQLERCERQISACAAWLRFGIGRSDDRAPDGAACPWQTVGGLSSAANAQDRFYHRRRCARSRPTKNPRHAPARSFPWRLAHRSGRASRMRATTDAGNRLVPARLPPRRDRSQSESECPRAGHYPAPPRRRGTSPQTRHRRRSSENERACSA